MKNEPVVGVQPEIFRWARDSVGLSVVDVATMLKRKPEEIEAWESGVGAPTYPQLEKLAYQIYKRPLAVFFLPSPPQETLPQREFRTLPDADMQALSRDTYLHIRRAHAYQIALRELFDSRNPIEHCIWKSLFLSPTQSVTAQAESIRELLGVTLEKQLGWKTDEQALKAWRKAIEDAGVFIFKAAFKQKDISGFCLMDEYLPVIYLNNTTTKTRQIFSLLHELAHLLFSMNGLSKFDTSYIERLPKAEKQIEQFCNAVAAEVLIPKVDFSIQVSDFPENAEKATEAQFSNLASRYGVSREAILRRFLDQKRVGKTFYESRAKFWTDQKQQAGGGNWYMNQGAYISNHFAREVISRHYRHQISLEQAADFLGIKPRNFPGFEERFMEGAGA
ncbi:MAG: ImmA/IrrE family metallo-endopeptidase [Methylococcaceae bacterium]|nr:MAG: ImmA/IrrE family metallo-endopeptidase [Methylococcaceae bacterium]